MRQAFRKILLLGLAFALSNIPAFAAKGPEVEAVPDLEEVIRPDAGGTAEFASDPAPTPKPATVNVPDPDLESLSDLEKVIEMEDSKPASAPERRDTRTVTRSRPAPQEDRRSLSNSNNYSDELPTPVETPPDDVVSFDDPAPTVQEAEARRPRPISRTARSERRPPASISASSIRNTITNLEFKMEGTGSRIVVTARSPLRYREVRNAGMRQVIYIFENTDTPERLQRAYDTTEFTSAVGLFTLLQVPGEKPPQSKLIVQLREDKEPTVLATDRGLYVDFTAPTSMPPRASTAGPVGKNGSRVLLDGDLYMGTQQFSGRRIKRLEIKNSDVADVLRLIAKSSGYNLVVGDDVSGKVNTLSLENVPWDQAFALVLQSKKLGYIMSGTVIRVGTLNSLKSEKEEALSSEQAKLKIEPLRTLLVPISFAKAADLATQGKNFLTQRGSIDVDTRTNTIVIKDVDRVATRVQKLFTALDTAPPRVAISARFVEVTRTSLFTLGSSINIQPSFSGLNIVANLAGPPVGTALTLRAPQFANLSTQLDLLEKEDLSRTLANPSITVVANQKASVNQSFSFFVPGADQAAVGVLAVPILKQITTNLQLDVTPIVAGDGSIFMNLVLKNEIPEGTGAATTIAGRNVTTQVLVDNGDTVVVGGVFSNTLFRSNQGLPFLRSLPVIGALFSTTTENMKRSEIMIFITAKITNAEESFRRNL